MEPQLCPTCVLYQCATVTPDVFSPGVPPPSGPKPTKKATTTKMARNPIQRVTPESFISIPPFVLCFGHEGA